ncbi:MAG: 3-dehydroquinate synthase, partial [bacterium]|nr:3-dehydroquinate synthase [bacterium]
YIQVPTTLLSMVDSSVGGKTAINLDDAKNIVGAFWQPEAVFVNVNFLKTLDEKQYKSGLGEILKYGFIESDCGYEPNQYLLEYLALGYKKLLTKDTITLVRVISNCLNLKSAVVNVDEKEGGLRKILNFGHTLAHALETITGYRKYTHGQAVVYGMFFIFEWAYSQNMITYSYYKLAMDLFAKYEFKNIDIVSKYDTDVLVDIMRNDKKAVSDKITFIVPCDKKMVKEIKMSPKEVLEMFK